ncbi:MAG: hypothetical protein F6K04_00895 [Leptolyngbya sp. SIO4C5]|nr:hypothetical protein [Leptolyngbya sp. SIO4C5]
MVSKNGGTKYDFDHQVRLRGFRNAKDEMSIILQHFEDDLPFDLDIIGSTKSMFAKRHLVFVLKQKGYPKEVIQHIAYQAIGYFEGIIRAIKNAADIKDEPDILPPSMLFSSERAELKNGHSSHDNRKDSTPIGDGLKSSNEEETKKIGQNFDRMRSMFEAN